MDSEHGLVVRKTARYDLVLPVSLSIHADHAELVRFGPRAGDLDGWLDADLMDIAMAGAGVVTKNFLPRNALVRLRILSLPGENQKVLVECTARVMRAIMADRRPSYMLGLAFDQNDPQGMRSVEELIDQCIDPELRVPREGGAA